jgi:hypothetical protein
MNASITTRPWEIYAQVVTKNTGGAGVGAVLGMGFFKHWDTSSATAANVIANEMFNSTGTLIDLTAALAVDVTADFATASTSNAFTFNCAIIEILF